MNVYNNKVSKVNKLDSVLDLKGKLLISSPMMMDERFLKSVIFVCDSKITNAFGFTIRKDHTVDNKIKKHLKGNQFKNDIIYSGGPVSPNRLFVIHTSDVEWQETLRINQDISITNFEEAIKVDLKPEKYLIVSGYTNWVSGQLEREIVLGFWLTVEDDAMMIFDQSKKDKWRYLMRSSDLNENTFAMQVGTS